MLPVVTDGVHSRGHMIGRRVVHIDLSALSIEHTWGTGLVEGIIQTADCPYLRVVCRPFNLEVVLAVVDRLEDLDAVLDICVEVPADEDVTKLSVVRWWKTRLQVMMFPHQELEQSTRELLAYDDEIIYHVRDEADFQKCLEVMERGLTQAGFVIVPGGPKVGMSDLVTWLLRYRVKDARIAPA
jgi:hypothetical protein